MEMRKYLVTVHKDGRITAVEYEEPQGFVYGSTDAYNHALRDVKTILEAEKTILEDEKTRCQANNKIDNIGQRWAYQYFESRSLECRVLETAIDKLFHKS